MKLLSKTKSLLLLAAVATAAACMMLPARAALAIPITGLVSHWQAEGNAQDSHGANHGALTNISFAAGKVGQAFSFNGSTSHVLISHNNNLNPDQAKGFSVVSWIKASTSQGGLFALIDKSHGFTDSTGWVMQGDSSGLGFAMGQGGAGSGDFASVSTGVSIKDDSWHHIAGVYDGTNMEMYLDGVLTSTLAVNAPANNTRDLFFGRTFGGGGRHFSGLLDEIAIYERALSQSDIQGIINEATAVPEPTTIVLLGIGLAGLAGTVARKRLKKRIRITDC